MNRGFNKYNNIILVLYIISMLSINVLAAPVDGGGGGEETHIPSANEAINIGLNSFDSVTPETTDLLGETVDLNNGTLGFSHTDVSLSGNSAIPMSIGRVYKDSQHSIDRVDFADWAIDIPHIRTTQVIGQRMPGPWGRGTECSEAPEIGFTSVGGEGLFQSSEYFNGVTLHVPGQITEKILYHGRPKTKSNWKIECATNTTLNEGEMFVVTSTGGLKYTFSQKALIRNGVLENNTGAISRYLVIMYVTKVEDRFGNYVNYNYNYTNGDFRNKPVLINIQANDGRLIEIERNLSAPNDRLITGISVNGRKWKYQYSFNHTASLSSVTRPDGKSWLIDLREFGWTYDLRNYCGIPNRQPKVGSITHPNGAKGIYTTEARLHGRSNVTRVYNPNKNIDYVKACTQQMSLVKKELSGPGILSLKWSYSYSENTGSYSDVGVNKNLLTGAIPPGVDRYNYKRTTVKAPNGSKTVYYHSRNYKSAFDGRLIVTEHYDKDGVSLLLRNMNTYAQGQVIGATYMQFVNTRPMEYRVNLVKNIIEKHYGANKTVFTIEYRDFNSYGAPQLTVESNSFNNNKLYTRNSYTHDLTNHLLNLPTKTELSSNGVNYYVVSERDYHSATGIYKTLPNFYYKFGRWLSRNESYHTSGVNAGLPKLSKKNATGRWSENSNYFRGIPRAIRIPKSKTTTSQYSYQTVDDNGWIKSRTDFKGNVTKYDYDSLGRLILIDPVDSKWSNTIITYGVASGNEEASYVKSGMLKKKTKQGRYERIEYFDALLRNVLTSERDIYDSSTKRYVRSAYDEYNNVVFQSFPSLSLSISSGYSTSYDGLNRKTSIIRTADNASVRYNYLPNNRVSVTDAKGNTTTTTYLAYGRPSQSQATYIDSPEGVDTSITYNLFGQIKI